jgi:glutaconate CoA-transferase subunit B
MLSKKITKQELLIVAAARQIANGDVAALGIGLPILAGAVAKQTHAPDAVLMMESGIVDFEPRVLPFNVADATCTRGYGYAIDLFSVFTTVGYAGYLDKAFLGVGQVDKYGNVNSTYLGKPPYAQRITAAGGAPEFGAYARETILTMTGPGFVETLPYVSTPGYLGGGDEREKSGRYTPGSGPSMLLTPKAIFRFDPVTKEMYLNALIPGLTVDEVKADVPWDLKVAAELKSFPIPTDAEIAFLRKLSPSNSFPNSVALALRTEFFEKKRKARNGQ